jgi:mono/diheme cytochrome c family protein
VRISTSLQILGSWTLGVLGVILISGSNVLAQSKPATQAMAQKDYEQLIYSVKGPDLFRAYCAPCHGLDGKGGGPVAPTLKTKPADLTAMAKSNGGSFPGEQASKTISGDAPSLRAHGTREMPVWGPIFHRIESDQDFGNVRVKNLVKYLESIQQK